RLPPLLRAERLGRGVRRRWLPRLAPRPPPSEEALPRRQGLFLSPGHMEPRAAVRGALERGERAVLVTVTGLEGDPPAREGMALGVLESGASFGTLGCEGFDRAGATDAARAL